MYWPCTVLYYKSIIYKYIYFILHTSRNSRNRIRRHIIWNLYYVDIYIYICKHRHCVKFAYIISKGYYYYLWISRRTCGSVIVIIYIYIYVICAYTLYNPETAPASPQTINDGVWKTDHKLYYTRYSEIRTINRHEEK